MNCSEHWGMSEWDRLADWHQALPSNPRVHRAGWPSGVCQLVLAQGWLFCNLGGLTTLATTASRSASIAFFSILHQSFLHALICHCRICFLTKTSPATTAKSGQDNHPCLACQWPRKSQHLLLRPTPPIHHGGQEGQAAGVSPLSLVSAPQEVV